MNIPSYSIYLNGNISEDNLDLPPKIALNISTINLFNPEYKHKVYFDKSIRSFIKKEFDKDVLYAYDRLIPLAYKADLARYCLLYNEGGLYVDLSIRFLRSIKSCHINGKEILVFRDSFSHAPWILSNSLILSERRLRLFEIMIISIIENVRNGYYGYTPLCPTGPNLFGRVFAQHMDPMDFSIGEVVKINKNKKTSSFAYLLPDGEVCSVSVKSGAGLSSLGSGHKDNYNKHYYKRNVYLSELVYNKRFGEIGGCDERIEKSANSNYDFNSEIFSTKEGFYKKKSFKTSATIILTRLFRSDYWGAFFFIRNAIKKLARRVMAHLP